jgi:predicted secreted Zn-dependent protease
MKWRRGAEPPREARSAVPERTMLLSGSIPDDLLLERTSQGAWPATAGRMLALQATRGNQFVRSLVEGAVLQRQAAGILAREATAAAGKTVFSPVANSTYSISAKTLAQAVARVEAYEAAHGEAGLTTWKPTLSYKLDDAGNVKSATVSVSIFVTLPSWPGAAKASAAARAEWNRALGVLKAHESEHAGIVRDKLTGVGESLVGMSEADAQAAYEKAKSNLKDASDAIDPFTVDVDTGIE